MDARAAVWIAFVILHTVIWGGIQDSELLIFLFFSDLEFLHSALIVPDAATAGGSSPRLCVDRVCPGLMLPLYL